MTAMMDKGRQAACGAESLGSVLAERAFSTDSGQLTLRVMAASADPPSFAYEIRDSHGEIVDSSTMFGVDTMQALLFCITAAGDYLRRFVPSASFADLGITGLLVTDLDAADEWSARVSLPTRSYKPDRG